MPVSVVQVAGRVFLTAFAIYWCACQATHSLFSSIHCAVSLCSLMFLYEHCELTTQRKTCRAYFLNIISAITAQISFYMSRWMYIAIYLMDYKHSCEVNTIVLSYDCSSSLWETHAFHHSFHVLSVFSYRSFLLFGATCLCFHLFIYFKLTPCLDSKIYVPQFHDDSSGMLRLFASCWSHYW